MISRTPYRPLPTDPQTPIKPQALVLPMLLITMTMVKFPLVMSQNLFPICTFTKLIKFYAMLPSDLYYVELLHLRRINFLSTFQNTIQIGSLGFCAQPQISSSPYLYVHLYSTFVLINVYKSVNTFRIKNMELRIGLFILLPQAGFDVGLQKTCLRTSMSAKYRNRNFKNLYCH